MDTRRVLAAYKKQGARIETKARIKLKTKKDFSLWYTPGVGIAASHLAKHPREAREMSIRKNSVAIVSDGSAVLGLGNIGPYGALPVMEGKALIFKEMAGIDAWPIVLDAHEPEEIVKIVKAIAPSFGGINLEDIAAPKCFEVETRLQDLGIPVMHDDQHGTAIVVLAGLINAAKVVKKDLKALKVVVSGAGAAGTAIAKLLAAAGVAHITLLDRQGIIHVGRADLTPHKRELASFTGLHHTHGGLAEALGDADVFIGVSGKGLLKARHIATMAPRAIVFALANPEPEILPAQARKAGAAVVATGRSDFPTRSIMRWCTPAFFAAPWTRELAKSRKRRNLPQRTLSRRSLPVPLGRRSFPTFSTSAWSVRSLRACANLPQAGAAHISQRPRSSRGTL